jgi:hypothetical protein
MIDKLAFHIPPLLICHANRLVVCKIQMAAQRFAYPIFELLMLLRNSLVQVRGFTYVEQAKWPRCQPCVTHENCIDTWQWRDWG